MNFLYKLSIILILFVILIYVCNITLLPSTVILNEGEILDLNTIYGIGVKGIQSKDIAMQASSNINKSKVSSVGSLDVSLNLFGKIPVKDMTVSVIPKTKVIPLGKAIGMKLYTDGVLVVGMTEINEKKPYENSGIREGDMIIEINNEKIDNTQDLIDTVNNCNGEELEVKYKREENTIVTSIKPVKINDDEYKLGLWVRDAAAGVGTMTFYEPTSGKFAALGHGITDIDTSELINISEGELVTTNIVSIVKGKKGMPGQIKGTIDGGSYLGDVTKNTEYGVYGKYFSQTTLDLRNSSEIEVALRAETKVGKAQIMCQLDNDKVEIYDIEIKKIYANNYENNKSMVIKITDERLINKTGGIIQGMSGAPIIQNGKFIGAVTHVLVNDPTTGYGVFADIMIKEMREVQ